MKLTIPMPDDWHVHFRQGRELENYASIHARSFGRALVMPNTVPPLTEPGQIVEYKNQINKAAPSMEVVSSFRLMPDMREDQISGLFNSGIKVGKYYPDGATTNSANGIKNWRAIEEALGTMEEKGMILSVHGENTRAPAEEREEAFLPEFREIRRAFKKLKIVFEHVSSASTVCEIADSDEYTAATVTLHHLLFTLEDLIGNSMNPHLFCKPVLKSRYDREAVAERVLTSDSKFFFGSDSAPHKKEAKESSLVPAGIFSSPVILPALAQWFEENSALDRMMPFLCLYGREFYGYPANPGTVTLERKEWTVPETEAGCVPLFAGKSLSWRIEGISGSGS